MMLSGSVLLWRFVKHNKNRLLVGQVELIDVNPIQTSIIYPDWYESTISMQDIVPCRESRKK